MIYVVTSGEHDQAGICAVFSRRELAEQYVEKYNFGDIHFDKAEIEEWPLDPEAKLMKFGASIDLRTGEAKPMDGELHFVDEEDEADAAPTSNYAFAYSDESQEDAIRLVIKMRERWLRGRELVKAAAQKGFLGVAF